MILKPLVTDYAGAGELINLVPTVLDFWPDLALSSFSCMDLIQNLVLTSWYVGTCYTTPATDTGNFGYGQKKTFSRHLIMGVFKCSTFVVCIEVKDIGKPKTMEVDDS